MDRQIGQYDLLIKINDCKQILQDTAGQIEALKLLIHARSQEMRSLAMTIATKVPYDSTTPYKTQRLVDQYHRKRKDITGLESAYEKMIDKYRAINSKYQEYYARYQQLSLQNQQNKKYDQYIATMPMARISEVHSQGEESLYGSNMTFGPMLESNITFNPNTSKYFAEPNNNARNQKDWLLGVELPPDFYHNKSKTEKAIPHKTEVQKNKEHQNITADLSLQKAKLLTLLREVENEQRKPNQTALRQNQLLIHKTKLNRAMSDINHQLSKQGYIVYAPCKPYKNTQQNLCNVTINNKPYLR